MTTTLIADPYAGWIRPWYPGAVVQEAGQFEAHTELDCLRLLRHRPVPVEGAGWLHPDDPLICTECRDGGDDEDDE